MYMYMCTMFVDARALCKYIFQLLPRSKCFSSKTCFMCNICTLWYVGCSNGTMNNSSMLRLSYRQISCFAHANAPLRNHLRIRRVKGASNFVLSGSKIVKRLPCRKYDPVIFERTIGFLLGPSTALYRSFRKHCNWTNESVETI